MTDGGRVLWTDSKTGIKVDVEGKYLGLDDKESENKLLSLQVDITAFSELIGLKARMVANGMTRAGRGGNIETNPQLILIEGNPPPQFHETYNIIGLPDEAILGRTIGNMFITPA